MSTVPVLRDGELIEVPADDVQPAPTLDEAKEAKRTSAKGQRDAILHGGWTHDFGAAGEHTLDLRNADDKANWTLLLIKTQGMIDAGAGAEMVKIQTAANVSVEVSADQANAAMQAFLAWGEDVLSRKWALDAEISAAADQAALDAIDVSTGWP